MVLSFGAGFLVALTILSVGAMFAFYLGRKHADEERRHNVEMFQGEGADQGVADPVHEPTEASGHAAELEACRDTLATVRASHEEALKTFEEHEDLTEYLGGLIEEMSPDRPVAFPEELDEVFQPEGFRAAVEALKQECPEVFGEGAKADCSEYPCMIEFPYKGEEVGQPQRIDLQAQCPALSTHFPGHMTQQFTSQVGDEAWIQFMPHGTGIGLEERLAGQEVRLAQRARKRWDGKRRSLAHELYEEDCVREQDAQACKSLAHAYGIEDAERDVYSQMGCDAGDSSACYTYANDRCEGRGRCDAEAEHFARRAIELAPDSGYMHQNLGIVLCGRGAVSEAQRSFEQACALGVERACGRRC